MQRRLFLSGVTALTASAFLTRTSLSGTDMNDIIALQQNWQKFVPKDLQLPTAEQTMEKDLAYWREQLDSKAFHVLFQEGTEHPFTSPLNGEKRDGIFLCAACDLPLFSSAMKYDSGTGWPSFFTSIPNHLGTKTDYKLVWPRTEYHCIRCGGHQGHVFSDGPAPTNERWCNNGVALRFMPASAQA